MKSFITAFMIIGVTYLLLASFIIIRHDVDDSKYIELAKKYHSVCHFLMGEGVLIESNWVLTAGHVGSDLKKDLEQGLKPKVKIESKDYEIEKVILHPGFHPIEDDIALVKLKSKVTDATPVKIYSQHSETGNSIVIVGLGDTGDGITGPKHWDKILRGATNKVDGVNDKWLWFDFDAPGSADETFLEGISGPGDSGGPAYLVENETLFVAGISSHQDDAGNKKGTYGVIEYYTRVSSYADWIIEEIKNN